MNKKDLYIANDGRYSVQLNEQVVTSLVANITSARRKETGGIILGFYNGDLNCAIVSSVTGAPKDSKSSLTWFYRGLKGLQDLINRQWQQKIYYLGEWHYHPNSTATPSKTDIDQMLQIARDHRYHCPEPLLLIIGGNPEIFEIRIFVTLKDGQIIELKQSKI